MFNAEQLLGKIISETLGGSGSGKKRKGRRSSGLLDSLASGQGLMTAIGLGVGAYEILKQQQQNKPGIPSGTSAPPSRPADSSSSASVPPPLPGSSRTPPPPPPVPSAAGGETAEETAPAEELARRMIQVMIAAAHADGILDEAEEKAILDRLRGAELDSEEKMFLLDELQRPKSVEELTSGIEDRSTAKAMYMLAAAAIEVDTEAERAWLDGLGEALSLSPEVRRFIEEQG